MAAFERGGWDGVGIVLAQPLSGVDLDDVVDPATGEVHPEALRIVHEIKSYTEISPSGRGLRIFTYGTLPKGWRDPGRAARPGVGCRRLHVLALPAVRPRASRISRGQVRGSG